MFGYNFWVLIVVGIIFGIVLCGYVLFFVLVSLLVFEKKGLVMVIVSFGVGMFYFIVFVIVGIFIGSMGVYGVMWIFVGLYFVSVILMIFMKLLGEKK